MGNYLLYMTFSCLYDNFYSGIKQIFCTNQKKKKNKPDIFKVLAIIIT